MNFFQSIQSMQVAGDWKITIANDNTGKLIVMVMLYNEKVTDGASKIIPPLRLIGTGEELDTGFFQIITAPIKQTDQLLTNMEHYEQELERSRQQSQMQRDKEKNKTDKEKKYDEAMKKVAELEAEGKHRDAWMKVPDPSQYPEKADEIRKRKSDLARQFAPDLFNEPKIEQP